MNRRETVFALVAIAAAPAGRAQQAGKVHRIGFVLPPRESGARALVQSFRDGLRQFGYVEGRNVVIDFRFADDDLSRLPALAAEVVRLNPDVIVTASPPGVRAVREATSSIPIVIGAVYDPVGQGFVASLGRPGGNITGMSVQYEDTVPKLLELIRTVAPATKKISVLRTVDPSHDSFLAQLVTLARPFAIQVATIIVNTPAEIEPALAKIGEANNEALVVLPHPMFNTRPGVIVALAAAKRVPAIYPFSSYADAGGLLSFGIDIADSFRRAASFVDRILKGAKPADLPVEQPHKIDLVLNLKTARALGLNIPQSILLRADRVIE